ncbi:unnamed protein product [Amoebophrya sp. A25]|nr:unnamed protein product [Amoebophrya sp. A25]|eukprot:GSA25T00000103001.1
MQARNSWRHDGNRVRRREDEQEQRNHRSRHHGDRNNQRNHRNNDEDGFYRKVSMKAVNWLRYKMREEHPGNKSNWVPWKAIPGAGKMFTEYQLQKAAEMDPTHLEKWWQTNMLYVRSTRKNKIESEGNDTNFWNNIDLDALYAKNTNADSEQQANGPRRLDDNMDTDMTSGSQTKSRDQKLDSPLEELMGGRGRYHSE